MFNDFWQMFIGNDDTCTFLPGFACWLQQPTWLHILTYRCKITANTSVRPTVNISLLNQLDNQLNNLMK